MRDPATMTPEEVQAEAELLRPEWEAADRLAASLFARQLADDKPKIALPPPDDSEWRHYADQFNRFLERHPDFSAEMEAEYCFFTERREVDSE